MVFTITQELIEEKLTVGYCERTGLKFSFEKPVKGMSNNPFAPSLDQKDPKQGYTIENIQVVVWQYNIGKGELTDEEYRQFLKNCGWNKND